MATNSTPSPIQQWEMKHISDDQTPRFLASVTVVTAIATGSVLLRYLARVTTKVGFAADDVAILLALLCAWAIFVLNIFQAKNGQGRHLLALSPEETIVYTKLLYAYDAVYITGIVFIQMSFLLFYKRVFTFQNKRFKWAVILTAALSICVYLSTLFVSLFNCLPVKSQWDFTITGHCINTKDFFIAACAINIFNDVLIVLIPVPMIWRIHIRTSEKIALLFAFMLGGFVTVGNAVRLPYLISAVPQDLTWSLVNGVIWGTAEIAIGITSACLPCFRPFLTWAKNTVTSIASRNSSSAHTNSTGKKHSTDGDSTAYSHTFHSTNNHTYVGSPDSDKDSEKFDDIPLQGRVDGEAPLAQHAAHFHHPNPTASSAHQQQPQMSGGIGVRQDVYVTRGSPTDTGRMV